MKMHDRKLKILYAIVRDYIETADAVGSRTLSKKYNLGVSAATIRNEMADLEELGYLTQPYTSSGRVPSDSAYREYVNYIMALKKKSSQKTHDLGSNLASKIGEMRELLHYSSKILSEITNYTTIALSPHIEECRVESIQFVKISSEMILAIIVTDTGIIRKPVFRIAGGIGSLTLQKITNLLNYKMKGLTLREVEKLLLGEIKKEASELENAAKKIVPELLRTLEKIDEYDFVFNGTANIFNFPEYSDAVKAKAFLTMLEKKQAMYDLIATINNDEISISIGKENDFEEAKNCSLITATLKSDGNIVGWLTVIGPTRMEYTKVLRDIRYVSAFVNELLSIKY
ncbi:MAG: heat-inducible transcriptional repressor HrcA [Alkaliphilus sp.]